MKKLEQTARYEGFFWAESQLTAMQSRNLPVPFSWPGTVEQARMMVDDFADEVLDPLDREWLAAIVLHCARSLWRELTRPDIAETGTMRMASNGRRTRHLRPGRRDQTGGGRRKVGTAVG